MLRDPSLSLPQLVCGPLRLSAVHHEGRRVFGLVHGRREFGLVHGRREFGLVHGRREFGLLVKQWCMGG